MSVPAHRAERGQTNVVTAMANTASAIAAVAAQPSALSGPPTVNSPITPGRAARTIIAAITGTATTPLITALRDRIVEATPCCKEWE
jgi:hypothetical protein